MRRFDRLARLALVSLLATTAGAAAPVAPVLFIGDVAPAEVRWLRADELVASGAGLRVPALAGAMAIRPQALASRVEGTRALVLEVHGEVSLAGDWALPAAAVEIRAGGPIVVRDVRLTGPGGRLLLEGTSVRLLSGAHVDLADPGGRGGEVRLVARGEEGSVEVDAAAVIDASGAPGRGGRILLAAGHVTAAGGLRALGRGRIEVEARDRLAFTAAADTGGGLVRLDPRNMTVSGGSDSNVDTTVIGGEHRKSPNDDAGGNLDAAVLATLLATNDVLVHTTDHTGVVPPAGLESALTGDTDGGDIVILAPVLWDSDHYLWFAAHDDLVVRADVQNAGTGSVAGLAGWDGATFADLDLATLADSAYGNGTGDAFVVGSGLAAAPPVAFGSRQGTSVLRGRDVTVRGGSVAFNNSSALLGFRITANLALSASGPILTTASRDARVESGSGTGILKFAQIGHGGGAPQGTLVTPTGAGDLSGAITVQAAGAVDLVNVTTAAGPNSSYAQIGHGGGLLAHSMRGDLSGDVEVTAASVSLVDGSRSGSYAQIGHGGWATGASGGSVAEGDLTGDIDVDVATDLDVLSLGDARNYAMIGHGGHLNTTGANNATRGTQTGEVAVAVGGALRLRASDRGGKAQVGHGGHVHVIGAAGGATGDLVLDVVGDASLVGGACINVSGCSVHIGHGGVVVGQVASRTSSRGALTGLLDLTVGGDLTLEGGTHGGGNGILSFAQVGHGGGIFSALAGNVASQAEATGDLIVDVAGALFVRAGTASLSYAQVGHGGVAYAQSSGSAQQGASSGALSVDAVPELELLAGPDSNSLASTYAQIGHGGLGIPTGGTVTQAGASGAISVDVGGETSLVGDPGGSEWWLGHRSFGPVTAAPVLLDTATLDFTAGPGATNATIDDPSFWPRFAVGNLPGGEVTLRVRGPSDNDGDLVSAQPLVVPAGTTERLRVLSTDDLTVDDAVTNDGSSLIDLVADDANPTPPSLSATALVTIGPAAAITGPVRLFAVAPSQYFPGTYVAPDQASGIWYETFGTPVVGVNFKEGADLVVTKVDEPDSVTPGTDLTYTITVTNSGPTVAASVTLDDTLPAETTFVSLTAPVGWTCATPAVGAGGAISCTIVTLASGSAVFTLVVTVDPAAVPGTTIENTAEVSSATAEAEPGNESAVATTMVGATAAFLTASKSVAGTFVPGGSIVYTVTITNAGGSPQGDNPGDELTDVLPAELSLVAANATSGSATAAPGTNTVTWNGALGPGESATLTVDATIDAGVTPGMAIANQALLAFDGDSDGDNEASGVSDDPAAPGQEDPTTFTVLSQSVLEIPTLGHLGLVALTLLLAAFGMRRLWG